MASKRIIWKENHLVSVRLRDDLYTIGQMLRSPYMRFFKLFRRDGRWANVDLNQVEVLFCVSIGSAVLQRLVEQKIKDKSVIPSTLPFEKYWIKPYLSLGGAFPFKGGRLIELDPTVGSAKAPTVKHNLTIEQDREIVEKYELTNMWGADDLAERLINYFDEGRDRDRFKEKVFGIGGR